MVDFSKMGTPRQQAERARRKQKMEQDTAKFAAMPDAKLAERAEHYMKNTAGGVLGVRWLAGDVVYDAVVVHVIIPEMIKRLKGSTS